MKKATIGLACGLLFGIGLVISGMVDPHRVLGFLDVTGTWDPTLAFVMGGALITTFAGYRWVLRQPSPFVASSFHLPSRAAIDARLVAGAALFGAGWGLGGYCPGPALTALTVGGLPAVVFVIGMLVGMAAARSSPTALLAGRVTRA